MGAAQRWVAQARVGMNVVVLGALVAMGVVAAGCGDDEESPPVEMPEGCVSGTVQTCTDRIAGCYAMGTRVCSGGTFSACTCPNMMMPMTDAAIADGSMPDGSTTDASTADDAAQRLGLHLRSMMQAQTLGLSPTFAIRARAAFPKRPMTSKVRS